MTERVQPTALELAALISSKICHDVIGSSAQSCDGRKSLAAPSEAAPTTHRYRFPRLGRLRAMPPAVRAAVLD